MKVLFMVSAISLFVTSCDPSREKISGGETGVEKEEQTQGPGTSDTNMGAGSAYDSDVGSGSATEDTSQETDTSSGQNQ
jgi:hypothetical protein